MNSDSRPTLIVLTGPTAVGKTSVGIRLSQLFRAEILSADSRQFYREMKIGTARPSIEELSMTPHHFIGHLSIHENYNVSRFENDVISILEKLFRHNRYALLVGGSGLYINAVCHGIDDLPDPDDALRETLQNLLRNEGIECLRSKLKDLDPVYYQEVDRSNPNRLIRALEVCMTTGIPFSTLRKKTLKERSFRIIKTGLTVPREELDKRINERVELMMETGLLQEVMDLLPYRNLNALNTVGYKELFYYLDGKYALHQAVEKIKTHTRRFAKRQMTWLKKDKEIHWFHPEDIDGIVELIRS